MTLTASVPGQTDKYMQLLELRIKSNRETRARRNAAVLTASDKLRAVGPNEALAVLAKCVREESA